MGLTREEPTGGTARRSEAARRPDRGEAARKRAAVELIANHEQVLRRTARRYSLCADDAEDAYQRTLEIILTKAPTDQVRELIAWAQTVTKHEALAIRRERERLLGVGAPAATGSGRAVDWVALIPAGGDGPDERAERREAIARSREALQALKPAELRALTLLGEGYSYAEIGELTGFSRTKINRCLAEGRERFRRLLSRSEDGSRCEEMRPMLSAFCDGEASAEEVAALREHLRACASCRATLRAYRATPGAVAALAPALPLSRSLLERAHAVLSEIHSRLPGQGGAADSVAAQVAAAGGTRGLGTAALAKLLTVCLGTAGGAAACVAAGVAPAPFDLAPDQTKAPRLERISIPPAEAAAAGPVGGEATPPAPATKPRGQRKRPAPAPAPNVAEAGATEYTVPSPPPAPAPAGGEPASPPSGAAAGEFGP
ncbi:MAG TPA: sigma-70 family RNA polymerase sigma factor [Solirubrobacterales bacterium]|nr:sigma-70 family RNA polymerase sigma factor [Solirubrobacterales bacterium]